MLPAVMSVAIDRQSDFDLLQTAAREAGGIALDYFRNGAESWDKRPGDPVSEADIAVNKRLEERLRSARADYGWLSEESVDDEARCLCPLVWVVDPIDGTRAFIKGRPEFSVSVALVEGGRPVLGAVYDPVADEFYAAAAGQGAWLNGKPVTITDCNDIDNAHLLVSRTETQKKIWRQVFNSENLTSISSVALKLARVAAGQADGTVSLWPKSDWDIAAGDLLVCEAGGAMQTVDGKPFAYNRPRPRHRGLVATGPSLMPRLRARLAELEAA